MSSCHPSTQRTLPLLPAFGREGLGAAPAAALGLHGKALLPVLANPVAKPKPTVNAHVIIKVHEVGAP